MIETEFGIIEQIEEKEYVKYEPEKYDCIAIDDDYLDKWWSQIEQMDTYYHSLTRPAKGLARCGITIIPPSSLSKFYDIVSNDKRIKQDKSLVALASKIQQAIEQNRYMIHFGV